MNHTGGTSKPTGEASLVVVRDLGNLRSRPSSGWMLSNFLKYRRREFPMNLAAAMTGWIPGVIQVKSRLDIRVYRRPENLDRERVNQIKRLLDWGFDARNLPALFGGSIIDYGTVSQRVVTTAGVGYIVDAFQNLVEVENMKFHGFGTGTNAEAAGDTQLQTELTTQYATDNTRPTGTTTEGASANIYRTVATLSPDTGGTIAVTEHGIFSANSAGVLLDRSVFSAVNVVAAADSLQTQYDLTFSSGG